MTDLGTLGGTRSVAVAINDRGQVVGWSETPAGVTHAVLWEAGSMTDLGAPTGGWSQASGINARGQIVGGLGDHAAIWEAGKVTDLGGLGGAGAFAARLVRDAVELDREASELAGDAATWAADIGRAVAAAAAASPRKNQRRVARIFQSPDHSPRG